MFACKSSYKYPRPWNLRVGFLNETPPLTMPHFGTREAAYVFSTWKKGTRSSHWSLPPSTVLGTFKPKISSQEVRQSSEHRNRLSAQLTQKQSAWVNSLIKKKSSLVWIQKPLQSMLLIWSWPYFVNTKPGSTVPPRPHFPIMREMVFTGRSETFPQ